MVRMETPVCDFGWKAVDFALPGVDGKTYTVTLTDEVDASRGDVLAADDAPPEVADQFEARLLWMSEHALAPGRQYLMKHACKEVTATITDLKHRQDVNTGAHLAAKKLVLNEIAVVNISTSAPLVFEPYAINQALGGFILIDKLTFETVGAGMIDFALRRASNIHWQALEITKATRAALKQQSPRCIWFTGLSGSGKSTIARKLEQTLFARGIHTFFLDGDNLRHGLNGDLGFSEADRVENIRRAAEVAKLAYAHGQLVLCSFISPFAADRAFARQILPEGRFLEVYVKCDLEVLKRRDTKGLYAKALRGEIPEFTGISSPYEEPQTAELVVETDLESVDDIIGRIIAYLTTHHLLPNPQ